ncbi:MAG: Ig-like domain-containing protein, partial [Eubacterium sp.]|nr:Ig-like domain-containing protein [Eubacterium sp.]
MNMKNLMKQKAMKFIATAAIVVGITFVGTAVNNEAVSAATTPVKVNYNGSERHNMKFEVGTTTPNNVSFTVPSSYGEIYNVKWESSDTSIFKIVGKTGTLGKSKCKLKMVTEGHAVLVLTVQTEKKTFREKVGISSFIDIPDYKCAAIRPIHVYRGATPNDYEVQADIGFQATGKQYKVKYRCDKYFFADDVDGQQYLDGSTHGFIKIADVESIHCPKKISIDERAYFLRPNQTEELDTYFEFDPSYSSTKVTYRSLNPSIATISSNGVITAKSVGSTKIEIKSLYGST